MSKFIGYFYIFSKLLTSIVLLMVITLMGYLLFRSYQDVDQVNNEFKSEIDEIDSCSKHKGVRLLKSHLFKSLILLPLFIQDKLIGTLSLYATSTSKFRLIETDFLENMAKQCSVALYTKKNINKE